MGVVILRLVLFFSVTDAGWFELVVVATTSTVAPGTSIGSSILLSSVMRTACNGHSPGERERGKTRHD